MKSDKFIYYNCMIHFSLAFVNFHKINLNHERNLCDVRSVTNQKINYLNYLSKYVI